MSEAVNSVAPPLSAATRERVRATRLGLSLDSWSVLVAIALAVLLRTGLIPAVPWDAGSAPKPAAAHASAGSIKN